MMNSSWHRQAPGIPDSQFSRGSVPMTKQEVRALTISRLRPAPDLTVWDVGAGSGSLAVEAALFSPGGAVFAVERSEEGCDLIRENCARFAVGHVTVVCGEAPAALSGLPAPHRVIIGGSGGKLGEILEVCADRLLPGGIVVLNLLLPANLSYALERLQKPPFVGLDGAYLQASRLEQLGGVHYFRALNGVWVISAQKEDS